jgi:hypothetical protein
MSNNYTKIMKNKGLTRLAIKAKIHCLSGCATGEIMVSNLGVIL